MPQATIATTTLLHCALLLSEIITQTRGHPYVTDVSAMCTNDGITASLEFDAPFSGKIYSTEFPMTHECIYYNALETKRIIFSIPLHKCGTKSTKNTRELQVIDLMENRIYVQMDKYAQTAYDRQYSFVCELAPNPYAPAIPIRSSNEIRRHPIVPNAFRDLGTPIVPVTESSRKGFGLERIDQIGPWAMPQFTVPFTTPPPFLFPPPKNPEWTQHLGQYRSSLDLQSDHFGDSSHIKEGFLPEVEKSFDESEKPPRRTTKSPEPTTTTDAIESSTVRAVIAPKVSGSSSDPRSVYLEIQKGDGPFNTTVKGPIQIGDKIALVVRGNAISKDTSHYNIFVHSCYASDGLGGTRIDLIDSAG
ncbi:Protein CUTL-24 b, partial [Aphelenchoides avenae]